MGREMSRRRDKKRCSEGIGENTDERREEKDEGKGWLGSTTNSKLPGLTFNLSF